VIVVSFGVTFYGCESSPGRLVSHTGVLILLRSGLLYRTRFLGREFRIPKEMISNVYVSKRHKGKNLFQYVMKIDFVNKNGDADSAAFRVPYPKQWFSAIERSLGIKPVAKLTEGD